MLLKASLIIPLFNQHNFDIVLTSLKNQVNINMDEFELILVNDGGEEIYHYLNQSYPFTIKYIQHEQNYGRSAARNTGAKNANSKILIFSDGDRILDPYFISKHVLSHTKDKTDHVIIGNPVEIFCGDTEIIKGNVSLMFNSNTNILWKYIFNNYYSEKVLKIYNNNGNTSCDVPWCTLFSANFSISSYLFNSIDGFDENYKKWGYENIDLGYVLHKRGIKFRYISEIVNFHIFHKQNRGVYEVGKNYFLNKYSHDPKIKSYFDYIEGVFPLRDFLGESVVDDVSFFSSNKIGSKFKLVTKENVK